MLIFHVLIASAPCFETTQPILGQNQLSYYRNVFSIYRHQVSKINEFFELRDEKLDCSWKSTILSSRDTSMLCTFNIK